MSDNDEFIAEFLEECDENLDQLDQELVALEDNPRDPERLKSIFRNIHTIKGSEVEHRGNRRRLSRTGLVYPCRLALQHP